MKLTRTRIHPVTYIGDDEAQIARKGDEIHAWGVYTLHHHGQELWEADFPFEGAPTGEAGLRAREEAELCAKGYERAHGGEADDE